MMLTVTKAALERLAHKLVHKQAADDMALRFKQVEECCWRLHLDRTRPEDATYTHRGRNVLLLDTVVAKTMAALTLDVSSTEAGSRLKLRRMTPGSE